MKTIALTTLSLILGTTAFADPYVLVEISARYEGFDRSRYPELTEINHDARNRMTAM